MSDQEKGDGLPPLLFAPDVAKLFQVKTSAAVTSMARRGKIRGKKVGKRWVFHRDELLASMRAEETSQAGRKAPEPDEPAPERREAREGPQGRPTARLGAIKRPTSSARCDRRPGARGTT